MKVDRARLSATQFQMHTDIHIVLLGSFLVAYLIAPKRDNTTKESDRSIEHRKRNHSTTK